MVIQLRTLGVLNLSEQRKGLDGLLQKIKSLGQAIGERIHEGR
jgi:hypothetical protein